MMVLLIVLAFGALYSIRLPVLVQKEYRRDLVAFTVFMFVSLVYSLLLISGLKLPFLGTEIKKLFKTYFRIG